MKHSILRLTLAAALATIATSAIAQEAPRTLTVPGTMTVSGERFAERCNDRAFSTAADRQSLAVRCERLLQEWKNEVATLALRRENPRVVAVVFAPRPGVAALPFDTVAALRGSSFAGFGVDR